MISDHHVRSPVLNINRACQTCHHWQEEELKARVEIIQDRVFALRNRAMDALVALFGDIKRPLALRGVRVAGVKTERPGPASGK